jgi:hypothetical protein
LSARPCGVCACVCVCVCVLCVFKRQHVVGGRMWLRQSHRPTVDSEPT